MFSKKDVIYAYTRKQAIADGVLIDVTEMARQAGFSAPVALTQAAWSEFVTVPEGVTGQDERGRLWDVLSVLRFHAKTKRHSGPEVFFSVYVLNREEDEPEVGDLKAVCGPDDDGSLCVTVMLPNED